MATIRPFKSYRPAKGMEAEISSLPYDVYNREEATKLVAEHPDLFLSIDRAETHFGKEVSTYDDVVYAKAAELLQTAIKEGKFIQDETPCYYIYEQTFAGRTQRGIVACAGVDDYLNGVIKKHENTRADKEEDRIRHVDTCNAQTGPIFLCYRNQAILDEIVNRIVTLDEPIYDFTKEDVHNRIFVISDEEEIGTIARIFSSIDHIYIADGHHRCASAVKVALKRRAEHPNDGPKAPYNFFLSVLFPVSDLMIMDYNRVLKDLNGHTTNEVLSLLRTHFTVEEVGTEAVKPSQKGTFGLYDGEKWYALSLSSQIDAADPVKSLDVSILQDLVLQPIFGIEDPKTDPRIDFVGGIRGLKELEKRCHEDGKIAFSMYPTSMEELIHVADAGMLMPPKSTWFEPKLLSGLFIHSLEGKSED